MNKEFIVLSDGNIAVTNENGHISKRQNYYNSQECLLTENKIEIIDNKLEKLNKVLQEQERVIFLSKWMLRIQPILLLLISSGMFIYGGLTEPTAFLINALYYGTTGFLCGTIAVSTTTIYFSILKPKYRKKVNKTRSEVTIAKKLKEDYEKELSTIKEKQLLVDPQTIFFNEPISLIEKTNGIKTYIDNQINKTYHESLSNKHKKLVLERKK